MPRATCHEECFYCDVPLAVQHEHDHAPIPKRHGGKQEYCVCINCHALKDRMLLADWPIKMTVEIMNGWGAMRPAVRIFVVKAMCLLMDVQK